MDRLSIGLAIAVLACASTTTEPEQEPPRFQTYVAGGDTLKLHRDSIYAARPANADVILVGQWRRSGDEFCAHPTVMQGLPFTCGATARGQDIGDPASIFLKDGKARVWRALP